MRAQEIIAALRKQIVEREPMPISNFLKLHRVFTHIVINKFPKNALYGIRQAFSGIHNPDINTVRTLLDESNFSECIDILRKYYEFQKMVYADAQLSSSPKTLSSKELYSQLRGKETANDVMTLEDLEDDNGKASTVE